MSVNRSDLIAHLGRTRFSLGDAAGARRDAESIARFLKERYGAEVWGIGSLFEEFRPFRKDSDIDLVAKGIPADRYFEILAEVEDQTSFSVDLIPWEEANDLIREIVFTSGSGCEAPGIPAGSSDGYTMRARASILHDFYSGIERIFVRIAQELDSVRPAVIRGLKNGVLNLRNC